jgi:hypothetical protein
MSARSHLQLGRASSVSGHVRFTAESDQLLQRSENEAVRLLERDA